MASKIVSVRFPDDQLVALQDRADRAGLNLSEYVRRRALGKVEVEAVEPPVAKVPPPTSTATPSPGTSPEPSSEPAEVEPSPPAADDDLEARVAARARQLYGRGLTRRKAKAQALRELA